jgi:hypothetical protein
VETHFAIKQSHRIESRLSSKGGKHGRGKETLVPPSLTDFDRTYLVHRLAIHNRFCRFGLVGDFTSHNNLAVLPWAGTDLKNQESAR